jgi:predicted signal transduction protein with EAL and GGDEF domain
MESDEKKFWDDCDGVFPEIIKIITAQSTKSYTSITNLKTNITWWSQRALDYFNIDDNCQLRGKEKGSKHVHPDDLATYRQGFVDRIAGKNLDKSWEYRIFDGSNYVRFRATAERINDKFGDPALVIVHYLNCGIAADVDSVTGLNTEPAMIRNIEEYLGSPHHPALLKIWLDQFSHINVMYGATFSDKILNRTAQVLTRIIGEEGYVYRISGAKFVVAFDDIDRERMIELHNLIVDAFARDIMVDGKRVPLKSSSGAIFVEPHMRDVNSVRSRLTYAMNHSRDEHHGELVIFNDEAAADVSESQFEVISVIHQCAIRNFEGFRLFYQPIADSTTGKICGMEALLRWEHEPYGLVSPGVFMEWIEEDPCIFDLGNWILRRALTDIRKIRGKVPGFFVNVNVAAAQLERKEFRSSVLNILNETGAKPEELCLELTERCRNLDINFLKKEVEFFHSHHVKVALDDFGTGHSSLSLALELPVDELKVDMSFIKDIKEKPQNQAMVQSIVDYANRTNTETCIEGIENKDVNEYISQFGATFHQGYYYSKPVPIEEFEKIL